MNFACIHCGREFSISAEQLGARGRCPHCRGEITLPGAENLDDQDQVYETLPPSKRHWLTNSVSGMGSMVFHTLLVLILALFSYGSGEGVGDAEEVHIGVLPIEQLNDSQEEEFSTDQQVAEHSSPNEFEETMEVEVPVDRTSDLTVEIDISAAAPSAAGGGGFEVGPSAMGGASLGGGSWDGMIQNLRRNGLDVVIAFDSTGSMSGEIRQVKDQISRIGTTLFNLVPKTRISICTYRDKGDDYVVRGLPLSNSLNDIQYYLDGIRAEGGQDHPEAVHSGLEWSVQKNKFRSRARKVILLFGDAPPHYQFKQLCLRIASDFRQQQNGIVSTVTCRRGSPMKDFVEIAQMGGGEAFVTANEREIMTQLMVLVFGSKHRSKVMEAFKMMDR